MVPLTGQGHLAKRDSRIGNFHDYIRVRSLIKRGVGWLVRGVGRNVTNGTQKKVKAFFYKTKGVSQLIFFFSYPKNKRKMDRLVVRVEIKQEEEDIAIKECSKASSRFIINQG